MRKKMEEPQVTPEEAPSLCGAVDIEEKAEDEKKLEDEKKAEEDKKVVRELLAQVGQVDNPDRKKMEEPVDIEEKAEDKPARKKMRYEVMEDADYE